MAHARLGRGRWAVIAALTMSLAAASIGQPAAAQDQDTWEYMTVLIAWNPTDTDGTTAYYIWPDISDNGGAGIPGLLSRYGSEGWELVEFQVETTITTTVEQLSPDPVTDAARWRAVFKRPVTVP